MKPKKKSTRKAKPIHLRLPTTKEWKGGFAKKDYKPKKYAVKRFSKFERSRRVNKSVYIRWINHYESLGEFKKAEALRKQLQRQFHI